MAHEATINARLPEELKRGGSAVLQSEGVSPTQLIRSLYRYMQQEGKIPECLNVQAEGAGVMRQKRMQTAHGVAGTIRLQSNLDIAQLRYERMQEKYGDLL